MHTEGKDCTRNDKKLVPDILDRLYLSIGTRESMFLLQGTANIIYGMYMPTLGRSLPGEL